MHEKKPSVLDNMNDLLKQNPYWESFAEAVTRVTRRIVDEPRWKLERLRHHTVLHRNDFFDTPRGQGKVSIIRKNVVDLETGAQTTDFLDNVEIDLGNDTAITIPIRTMPERTVMKHNNAMLGFDFFSDKLSDADEQRIMRYISKYWPHSGDQNFVKFISFIKNVRFEIFQLNTPDYGDPDTNQKVDQYLYLERFVPFLETWTYDRPGFDWSKATPPEGFGGVYPTSHVELEHDAIVNPNPDYDGTTELFYFLAPIHLVLERYVSAVYAPQFDMYQATIGSFDQINNSRYEWSPDAFIEASSNIVASFDVRQCAVLCLNSLFQNEFPLPVLEID